MTMACPNPISSIEPVLPDQIRREPSKLSERKGKAAEVSKKQFATFSTKKGGGEKRGKNKEKARRQQISYHYLYRRQETGWRGGGEAGRSLCSPHTTVYRQIWLYETFNRESGKGCAEKFI
jgi:hypothetical protein